MELLNEQQLRMLIGYRPKTYQWRTHTTVLLILDTGLRVSEALNLRQGHVNADDMISKVFGKGQKPARQLLNQAFVHYLQVFARVKPRRSPSGSLTI